MGLGDGGYWRGSPAPRFDYAFVFSPLFFTSAMPQGATMGTGVTQNLLVFHHVSSSSHLFLPQPPSSHWSRVRCFHSNVPDGKPERKQ